MIEQLNQTYAIDNHVHFEVGEGGLIKAVIANQYAEAELYLHGAHVTHFQPKGHEPVLWMSSQAKYQKDTALRGGIPIIWPWFGPHPTEPSKPQHGFVRVSAWSVADTHVSETGATIVQLAFENNETTETVWPHRFLLKLTVTIGETMQVDLTATNTDSQPFDAGAALHTYFNVGDVKEIQLAGLDGRDYLDKVTEYNQKRQQGPIQIGSEVDRIYLNTEDEVTIHDNALERQILVAKTGSQSTVVWNPWQKRAAGIGDFPDDGYQTMVCVETANAASDIRTIHPGESHTLSQRISVLPVG